MNETERRGGCAALCLSWYLGRERALSLSTEFMYGSEGTADCFVHSP